MSSTTLGVVLGGLVFVACFIDRQSESLECEDTAECEARFPGERRQCTSNLCIVPNCPDDCTACDEAGKICTVDCSSTAECDATVTCPSGWTCNVTCNGASACNDISCSSGSKCNIVCSGASSCGDINCSSACKCDLECAAGACASKNCPVVGNGANQMQCTIDGIDGSSCDSGRAAGCTKC